MRASPQGPDESYLRQIQRLLEAGMLVAGPPGIPAASAPPDGGQTEPSERRSLPLVGELTLKDAFPPLPPSLLAPLGLPGEERPALPESWTVVEGGGRAAALGLSLSGPTEVSSHLGEALQSPLAEQESGSERLPLTVELSAPEPQGSPVASEALVAPHHTGLLEALEEEMEVAGRRYPGNWGTAQ